MKKSNVIFAAMLFFILGFSERVAAKQTIQIKAAKGDMTLTVRKAIEEATDKDLKIVFEKGIYTFLPDYALDRYSIITNHGNGLKKVIFRFEGFNSLDIEGNGSEFVFHGQVAPFQIENCKKVNIQNVVIDWDIPFLFQGEVLAVNAKEGWWEFKPLTKGYSWKMVKNKIIFPNIDDFNYSSFGQTLSFDPKTKDVFHGDFTFDNDPEKIEKLANGALRFYQKLRNYPSVGSVFGSKGDRQNDRYAPAFQTQNSTNVVFDKVIVHHALGMAFLFERTENIKILNSGVYVREGSDRVISSTADATHFANCKGDILVEKLPH